MRPARPSGDVIPHRPYGRRTLTSVRGGRARARCRSCACRIRRFWPSWRPIVGCYPCPRLCVTAHAGRRADEVRPDMVMPPIRMKPVIGFGWRPFFPSSSACFIRLRHPNPGYGFRYPLTALRPRPAGMASKCPTGGFLRIRTDWKRKKENDHPICPLYVRKGRKPIWE